MCATNSTSNIKEKKVKTKELVVKEQKIELKHMLYKLAGKQKKETQKY